MSQIFTCYMGNFQQTRIVAQNTDFYGLSLKVYFVLEMCTNPQSKYQSMAPISCTSTMSFHRTRFCKFSETIRHCYGNTLPRQSVQACYVLDWRRIYKNKYTHWIVLFKTDNTNHWRAWIKMQIEVAHYYFFSNMELPFKFLWVKTQPMMSSHADDLIWL